MYARLIPAVSANAAARDDEIFGVRTARTNGISHSLLCGRFSLTPCILAVPCRHRGVTELISPRALHTLRTCTLLCLSRALSLQACSAAVLSVH